MRLREDRRRRPRYRHVKEANLEDHGGSVNIMRSQPAHAPLYRLAGAGHHMNRATLRFPGWDHLVMTESRGW